MAKGCAGVGLAMLAALPSHAAVFEVGDDGSVVQLDVIVSPAVPRPVAARTPTRSARGQTLRPLIRHAAEHYAVSPALIDAIAHTESRYNQAAVSRAGATGIMQLMPGTARALGVDRTDAAANIRGGTAYLRQLLNRFDGNLVCTIAAYNAGPGAVSQARCIPPYRETVAYVAAVLDHLSASAD